MVLGFHLHSFRFEIDDLQQICVETESIRDRLKQYYTKCFPKICKKCGVIYRAPSDYHQLVLKTDALDRSASSAVFEQNQLVERRLCSCGSELQIRVRGDRRDLSDSGIRRRDMFEVWVAKMARRTQKPQREVRNELRLILRAFDNLLTVKVTPGF